MHRGPQSYAEKSFFDLERRVTPRTAELRGEKHFCWECGITLRTGKLRREIILYLFLREPLWSSANLRVTLMEIL
jgi:hypothetical protein